MTAYFEQDLAVSSNDARHPDAPVTITFGGGTLQMTEAEAAVLAEAIQRLLENREYRRLRVGDQVIIRDDDGVDTVRTVRAEPWRLGHGQWVVGLEGISGGYSLDRVMGIIKG